MVLRQSLSPFSCLPGRCVSAPTESSTCLLPLAGAGRWEELRERTSHTWGSAAILFGPRPISAAGECYGIELEWREERLASEKA